MNAISEKEALAVLTTIPELGRSELIHLLEMYGSGIQVLQGAEFKAKKPKSDKIWRQNLELVREYNAEIISFKCHDYPKHLLEIPHFPLILYVRGKIKKIDTQGLAIIGTRTPTDYGKSKAHEISRDLAHFGFTIVSGLARGIDAAAHTSALEKGRTLAVLGSGLGNIYPLENRGLAEMIIKNGALISEFPMNSAPEKHNFLQRNRIVTGMSRGVIIIESPLKGGTMNSAENAITQGKKLYAIPGRACEESFQGNHKLIKEGYASLIESAKDITKNHNLLTYNCCNFDKEGLSSYQRST